MLDPFLMHPFIDPLGRPSDKPLDQEQGITDNPHLFIGEIILLKSALKELTFEQVVFAEEMLIKCKVAAGLYSRHPKSFFQEYPFTINKMSHDENNGIAFQGSTIGMCKYHVDQMVEYLRVYNNQYYDLVPYGDFFRALKKDPIGTIKKLKALLDDYKKNPHDTNAVDLRHDKDVVALTAYRQPRDVAFYLIASNQKPSLFQVINLALAICLTTKKTIHDGSRGGTMLMAWFRNVCLKNFKLDKPLYLPLRLAIAFFNKRLIKKYGEKFPVVLIDAYFDRVSSQGSRHPMISLVKRYVDKIGI